MKIIEFNPAGKPMAISPAAAAADEASFNEALIGVLPLVFHKLKNKLTPILGYTQILQSHGVDAFVAERLGRIERNAAELGEALNALKEYHQPAPPALRPGDLNAVVEGLASRWQALADAAGARIVLELREGLPGLPLHAGLLRVLLLCLAENAGCALAAKPAGEREIRVATGLDPLGGAVLLSVRDNGCGMSAEESASAWMPFHSTFPGRVGLGLSLCEKVVADHGAACRVESAPGEFSEFIVTFPPPAPGRAGQESETCSQP